MRSFCSGAMRAQTVAVFKRDCNALSSIVAIWSPERMLVSAAALAARMAGLAGMEELLRTCVLCLGRVT